jgi:hypothetical protein
MQVAVGYARAGRGGLLRVVWKALVALVALVAVLGLISLGTLFIEAVLPKLPDQARAGAAVRPGVLDAAAHSGAAPQGPRTVEHFHGQFHLTPGADTSAHADTF